jgi:toxic protein SymE
MKQRESATTASTPYKKLRRMTVGYHGTDKPGVDVPYMRLWGRWLRDAGFTIGRRVKVEVSEGRLMIEQVD